MKAHKRTNTLWLGRPAEHREAYAELERIASKWAKKQTVRMKG